MVKMIKWHKSKALWESIMFMGVVCSFLAAVWLAEGFGYQRAIKTNHEATATEKERIIAEYWCDLSHGESVRVCDDYRPYPAPRAK